MPMQWDLLAAVGRFFAAACFVRLGYVAKLHSDGNPDKLEALTNGAKAP